VPGNRHSYRDNNYHLSEMPALAFLINAMGLYSFTGGAKARLDSPMVWELDCQI